MQYVSPFREIGIEIGTHLDKSGLNLAKKRLLAELELSDSPTILRGSVEMTKDDIINEFDKLAKLKNWDFHRLIAADKALLGFIQNKEWGDQKQLLKEPKYSDAAFITFISPYFYESYNTLIINYLADSDIKNLVAVLNIKPSLLTENDQAIGWFSVEAFLEDWQDNLNEIVENMANGEGYSDEELELYSGKQFIECLNLLPPDFKMFRDNYAESLYNLSGSSWNNEQYYRAVNILKNAQLLDIFEETQQMLAERRQLYKKDGHQSGYGSIFRIIIFIFVMIKAAGAMLNSPTNVVYSDERFIEHQARLERTTICLEDRNSTFELLMQLRIRKDSNLQPFG